MELPLLSFSNQRDNLKKGKIDSLYYMDNYISCEEEKALLTSIYENDWKNLAGRRVQSWGGNVTSEGLEEEPLPSFLIPICEKLFKFDVFENIPNHVLINEYDGDQGIMHHKDGPAYYPRVAIVTLDGSSALTFKRSFNSPNDELNVIVFPRSLLIFEDSLYHDFLHGINQKWDDIVDEKTVNCETEEKGKLFERTTRVSLTIRYVPPKK